jgi:hypothetical protein
MHMNSALFLIINRIDHTHLKFVPNMYIALQSKVAEEGKFADRFSVLA